MSEFIPISASLPQSPKRGISASGGTPAKKSISAKSRNRSGGSMLSVDYGKRKVKAYPVTESELTQLAWVGSFSTICFSLSTLCLGYAISIEQSLDFAGNIPSHVREHWIRLENILFFLMGAFGIAGGALSLFNLLSRNEIKSDTKFDEE